jgi:hypothetical protein
MKRLFIGALALSAMLSAKSQNIVVYDGSDMKIWAAKSSMAPNAWILQVQSNRSCHHTITYTSVSGTSFVWNTATTPTGGSLGTGVPLTTLSVNVCFGTSDCNEPAVCHEIRNPFVTLPVKFEYVKLVKKGK